MKKQIKSVVKTTCDHTSEDQKLLDKLNRIFGKNRKVTEKYGRLMCAETIDKDELAKTSDEITRLSRQFKDLVACLPQIKFNNSTGKYMFRYDENGQERFCVRIDVSKTYEVTVSAKDWKTACKAASDELLDDLIKPLSCDVKFTDMSLSVN